MYKRQGGKAHVERVARGGGEATHFAAQHTSSAHVAPEASAGRARAIMTRIIMKEGGVVCETGAGCQRCSRTGAKGMMRSCGRGAEGEGGALAQGGAGGAGAGRDGGRRGGGRTLGCRLRWTEITTM